MEPPLTPKIQVLAPPDELSEDEIQYIGVGLGTLSTADKKRRLNPPGRAATEPNLSLHHRSSSESIRSDASVTSGQLTPVEPMVYESPAITHENVFEHAFQRAEDKIRLTAGEHTTVYNTWRSEEMRGEPISNKYGREKVELERIDGDGDSRPRWERVLKEKLPEKLAELHQRGGERKAMLKENVASFAGKMLGEPEVPKSEKTDSQPQSTERKVWEGMLGIRAQKQVGVVKATLNTLQSGLSAHDVPETGENQSTDQK
jgi:hypothetical protein